MVVKRYTPELGTACQGDKLQRNTLKETAEVVHSGDLNRSLETGRPFEFRKTDSFND